MGNIDEEEHEEPDIIPEFHLRTFLQLKSSKSGVKISSIAAHVSIDEINKGDILTKINGICVRYKKASDIQRLLDQHDCILTFQSCKEDVDQKNEWVAGSNVFNNPFMMLKKDKHNPSHPIVIILSFLSFLSFNDITELKQKFYTK